MDNHGESIMSRIDHYLGNDLWFTKFPNVVVHYLNSRISYHTPLKLCFDLEMSGGGRTFQFFNHLAQHPQFMTIV